MNTRETKNKQGFTLVEMLVALAIAAIAIPVILSSFMALSTSMTASQYYRDMHYGVRHAMDLITRDIARGHSVSACSPSSSLTLKTGSDTNTVVYLLENKILKRNGVDLTSNGVKSVAFTLYDQSGTNSVNSASPGSAYFVDVKIVMEQKGVRNTYNDELRVRSRMRCKGL